VTGSFGGLIQANSESLVLRGRSGPSSRAAACQHIQYRRHPKKNDVFGVCGVVGDDVPGAGWREYKKMKPGLTKCGLLEVMAGSKKFSKDAVAVLIDYGRHSPKTCVGHFDVAEKNCECAEAIR